MKSFTGRLIRRRSHWTTVQTKPKQPRRKHTKQPQRHKHANTRAQQPEPNKFISGLLDEGAGGLQGLREPPELIVDVRTLLLHRVQLLDLQLHIRLAKPHLFFATSKKRRIDSTGESGRGTLLVKRMSNVNG